MQSILSSGALSAILLALPAACGAVPTCKSQSDPLCIGENADQGGSLLASHFDLDRSLIKAMTSDEDQHKGLRPRASWVQKHNKLEEVAQEEQDTLTEFIEAQKASGDVCSSRLLEAKRSLDGLLHDLKSLSVQVKDHMWILNTEEENLKATQLSIDAVNDEYLEDTIKCDKEREQALEDLTQYTAELEELTQIAKPSVRYKHVVTVEDYSGEYQNSTTVEAQGQTVEALLEEPTWTMKSCEAFVAYAKDHKDTKFMNMLQDVSDANTTAPRFKDLGAGCCSGKADQSRPALMTKATWKGFRKNLKLCQQKCQQQGAQKCGFIEYGWKNGEGKWCVVHPPATECSSTKAGPKDCGSGGGNNGVHAYKFLETTRPGIMKVKIVSGAYACVKTGAKCVKKDFFVDPGIKESRGTGLERNAIGVTCCDKKGVGTRPGCKSGVTFAEAKSHCESSGLQLCSAKEIKAGAGEATGCKFDHGLVWTSTAKYETPIVEGPKFNCKTKETWSKAKKKWCCKHEGICETGGPDPKPEKYDCRKRKTWTPEQKIWCCKNKGLGCSTTEIKPTSVTITKPPTEKGVDDFDEDEPEEDDGEDIEGPDAGDLGGDAGVEGGEGGTSAGSGSSGDDDSTEEADTFDAEKPTRPKPTSPKPTSPIHLSCNRQRNKLQRIFTKAYNAVEDLKKDAKERSEDNTCQETANATKASLMVPLVAQREQAAARIEYSSGALAALDPVLQMVSDRVDQLQKYMHDKLTPECKKASEVSKYLQSVRDLIISLEKCPGRDDFTLKIPGDKRRGKM